MSDPDKTTLVAEVLASPRGRAAVLAGRPGSVVRLVRSSLGWTQAELGERIGYSQATVSRLESGRGRIVDVVVLAKLADVLAIPPAALGVAGPPPNPNGRDAGQPEHLAIPNSGLTLGRWGSQEDSVKRTEFMRGVMGAVAAVALPQAIADDSTSRIGADTVRACRAALDRLYGLDTRHGGAHAYHLAVHMTQRLQRTLDRVTCTPTVGCQLQAILAASAEHAAWSAFDAGRGDLARRWWLESLHAADLGRATEARVIALASMSLDAVDRCGGSKAVDLIDVARRAASGTGATPRLFSLLAAREALGHAAMGRKSPAARALATAHRNLDAGERSEEPAWLGFWGAADLSWHEGRVAALLGEHRIAVTACRTAVAAADPALSRNVALYQAGLGTMLVRAGELEEAVAVTTPLVAGSRGFGSRRLVAAIHDTRRLLATHDGYPPARQFVAWASRLLTEAPV